jgi:hypothetical protein
LLQLKIRSSGALTEKISALIRPMSLGDRNTVYDLQNYVVGLSPDGLTLTADGDIDERSSFKTVDYFPLFASQTVRNNPQQGISSRPIDFSAFALPPESVATRADVGERMLSQAIWLYGDETHQLLELVSRHENAMDIKLLPVSHLKQERDGAITWQESGWKDDLPMRLFEDEELRVPAGDSRQHWLSEWQSEKDWFDALENCTYSNGVIGITEEMLPPELALPGQKDAGLLGKLELERRNLVQADLILFASDHWNFNVRNFNPGGNHGSFLRISTHSVWMMAGAGIPAGKRIEQPYDSLNFASTVLELVGKEAPMPERAIASFQ